MPQQSNLSESKTKHYSALDNSHTCDNHVLFPNNVVEALNEFCEIVIIYTNMMIV